MDQYHIKISSRNSKKYKFYSRSKLRVIFVPFLLAHPVDPLIILLLSNISYIKALL